MFNVVAALQQRWGNALTTLKSDVVTTSETDVGTTLIFDRATKLWQRQQRLCDNVVTKSLCQLGISLSQLYQGNLIYSWKYIIRIIILKHDDVIKKVTWLWLLFWDFLKDIM